VSGDTTAGGLARMDWTLTPDVDAMIVALGGNDYLRGIDPSASRANLDSILGKAQAAGVDVLLVGITAGGNYGPEYKQDFDAMYVDLAAKYDVPMIDSFFRGLLDKAGTRQNVQAYFQSDGIHPNKEGVAAIVTVLGPAVLDLVAQAGG
jgi:acyl-CoA thioesterase-1